jgi:hypothetical protein
MLLGITYTYCSDMNIVEISRLGTTAEGQGGKNDCV